MKFYSTNDSSHIVTLRDAVLQGLAPDSGLYMPVEIPRISQDFLKNSSSLSFQAIGQEVTKTLFSNDLTIQEIYELIDHTLTFDAPLVPISEQIYSLELFHGPTLAFKDFGARFCSKLMSILMKENFENIKVLVATSGDTGSAVANGFFDIPGIEVVILYPKDKVSEIQEKQFTTLGKNITAIEVEGTFDDCQRLVKEAFLDPILSTKLTLTSANSINVARWIPQCLYYFYSRSKLPKAKKTAYSVPSGNFGNLAAGILAIKMGLDIDIFIAATNSNNIVPLYLNGDNFSPRSSISTISNSMDVGNPSNFPRLLSLFNNETECRNKIKGYFFSDKDTESAMKKVFKDSSYILDPHGAVAYLALSQFLKENSEYQGVFLETAHPAKFKSTVDQTLETNIEIPEKLRTFLSGKKIAYQMSSNFSQFREFLLS